MQFDREPQFWNLQDCTAVGFQNSRNFKEESRLISNVFHQGYGNGDGDRSIPDWQPFRAGLNPQGIRFDGVCEGKAI
jgi:hypothetical protein